MNINGIGMTRQQAAAYGVRQPGRNERPYASFEEVREQAQEKAVGQTEEEQDEEKEQDEQKTDTEIVVKADGSKILMTTIRVGGTETVMSMEIAKPNILPAGNPGSITADHNMMTSDNSAAIDSLGKTQTGSGGK